MSWHENVATSLLQSTEAMGYDPLPLFHDLVQERFADLGDAMAILDGTTNERRTYTQLARDRDGVAAALQVSESVNPVRVAGVDDAPLIAVEAATGDFDRGR